MTATIIDFGVYRAKRAALKAAKTLQTDEQIATIMQEPKDILPTWSPDVEQFWKDLEHMGIVGERL